MGSEAVLTENLSLISISESKEIMENNEEDEAWDGEEMEYWGFCSHCAENYDELFSKAENMRCFLRELRERQRETLRIQMEMEVREKERGRSLF